MVLFIAGFGSCFIFFYIIGKITQRKIKNNNKLSSLLSEKDIKKINDVINKKFLEEELKIKLEKEKALKDLDQEIIEKIKNLSIKKDVK